MDVWYTVLRERIRDILFYFEDFAWSDLITTLAVCPRLWGEATDHSY